MRLREYLVDRSLWSDEARLALNLIGRSFAGLWRPLDWQQGAPVGFLMVQKCIISLLGDGEFAMRLVPLLAGIASLILFYIFARRVTGAGAGLVGLAMMCFSKGLIYYASEVKQYSMDVLVSLLILLFAARCFEEVDAQRLRRRVLSWGLLSAILLWFSHPAVFVIAGTGLVLIFWLRGQLRWLVVGAACAAAASFAADYFLVLAPLRHSAYLHEFWQEGGFLPRPIGLHSIGWFWNAYFRAFRTPGGIKLPVLTPIVFLVGAVTLWMRKRWLAGILLLPTFIALGSAAMNEYPYLHRLILFVLPMLFMIAGVGLESIWRMIPGPRWLVIGVCCGALVGGAAVASAIRFIHPEPVEEMKPVLAYLTAHEASDEKLYVYWASEPALRYYAPRYGIDLSRVVLGLGKDDAGLARDIAQLPSGRDWILISHALEHDQNFILKNLDERGERTAEFTAPGAAVYEYRLN